jgi:predicted ester cyclase
VHGGAPHGSDTATEGHRVQSPTEARIRSRSDLQRYLDYFNNRQYERQIEFYAPDVLYKVGTLTLSSPRAIADFYADFHEHCKEHVEIAQFALEGDACAVVMPSRFEPFRNYQKHGLDFQAGKLVEFVSFIFYTLQDGKIRRIRVARYAGSAADFKS